MKGTRPILCLLGACCLLGIAPVQAWATPSAQSVSAATPQDVPADLTLHGGSNLDSPVTFSIVTGPAHGSLGSIGSPACSFNPGATDCTAPVTYTPDPGYSGPDAFTYRVGDADGTADATASITVVAPPPPGYTATAFTPVDPGTAGTLALPGIQGTLVNPSSAPGSALFVIATYPVSATSASYDVRVISAGTGATLTVTFTYAGDGLPALLFFDPHVGGLVPVQSSQYAVDPVAHTITAIFDGTSTPKVSELTGTRFVTTVPPRVESLRVRPRCVRSGADRPASLRLSLSEAAGVDVTLARRKGSSDRARCGTHQRTRRHGRARFERPRRLSRQLPAGSSRIRLPHLAPGAYRVSVTATNANGTSSETRELLVLA